MPRFHALMVLMLFLSSVQLVYAAHDLEDGKDPRYWRNASVVVAITGRSSISPGSIELSVLATVTGAFDPARHPKTITARALFGDQSAVSDPPAIGKLVMVLIHQRPDGTIGVPSGTILFFPQRNAICEINDFTDPRFRGVIDVLRDLRASDR